MSCTCYQSLLSRTILVPNKNNISASCITSLYEHIAFPCPAGSVLKGACLSGISLPYHSLERFWVLQGWGGVIIYNPPGCGYLVTNKSDSHRLSTKVILL